MRNDPNKVLRISTSTTLNARDYKMVLADATGGAIALVLISPAGLSEWSIKVANVGTGSDVTLSVAGGGSFSHVLPAGAAAIIEQDDLGVLHVFGSVSAGGGSGIGGSGTAGTVPLFFTGTTVGDSMFNQSSGVGSIGAGFGVDESDGEIVSYSGSSPTDGQLIIGDTGSTMKLGSLASADASVVITPSAGGIDLSAANAGVPARAATNTLLLANDVVSAETVTFGADVYEIEIVNTDSTDNTQGGDFVPLTNPLVVVDAVTNYPGVFTQVVGDLIRIGTEIMRITAKDAADLTFQRGVSATTIATHADAEDIFIGDGIAGGSTVAVGLVATLTATVFAPALIDDIGTEGTEPFSPSVGTGNNVVMTANTVGAAGNGVVCSETLTGAGNHWEALETFNGQDAGQTPLVYRALLLENATDPPEASVIENTLGLIVWTRANAGDYVGTLAGAFAGLTSLSHGDGIPSGAGQYSVVTLTRIDDNSVSLKTIDVTMATGAAVLADDLLAGTYVEIIAWS
jgi:hypothetical protein